MSFGREERSSTAALSESYGSGNPPPESYRRDRPDSSASYRHLKSDPEELEDSSSREPRRIVGLVSGSGRYPESGRGLGYDGSDEHPRDLHSSTRESRYSLPAESPGSRHPPGVRPMPGLHSRPLSPASRLPGIADLEMEVLPSRPHEDMHGSSAGRGAMATGEHVSPRRSLPYRVPGPHHVFGGSQVRTPVLSNSNASPASTYGNPPMIHPSLAGLPGAGGGQGGKQQPSFVSKLYSMLEDPSIEDMISWGPSGNVFSVANPAEFSRLVLPNWFKHSNWQSFVRQLNMYGFHKVNHSYQGSPADEVQVWEFRHPSFRRGEIGLLNDIKRKSSRQKRTGSPNRSLGGADLRGDRSGGSSTPSPEVPLAMIPNDMARPRSGMYKSERDAYGMDSRMDRRAYEGRSDHRGYPIDGGGYQPYAAEAGFARAKAEPVMSHLGRAPYVDDRGYRDTPFDRNEAFARVEDLSERTDAIIRHASFLESQVRLLSEQVNDSRAGARQWVREEMTLFLEHLARSLSASAQSSSDPLRAMLDAIHSELGGSAASRASTSD